MEQAENPGGWGIGGGGVSKEEKEHMEMENHVVIVGGV